MLVRWKSSVSRLSQSFLESPAAFSSLIFPVFPSFYIESLSEQSEGSLPYRDMRFSGQAVKSYMVNGLFFSTQYTSIWKKNHLFFHKKTH